MGRARNGGEPSMTYGPAPSAANAVMNRTVGQHTGVTYDCSDESLIAFRQVDNNSESFEAVEHGRGVVAGRDTNDFAFTFGECCAHQRTVGDAFRGRHNNVGDDGSVGPTNQQPVGKFECHDKACTDGRNPRAIRPPRKISDLVLSISTTATPRLLCAT
jgi:hypothetical protein